MAYAPLQLFYCASQVLPRAKPKPPSLRRRFRCGPRSGVAATMSQAVTRPLGSKGTIDMEVGVFLGVINAEAVVQ